MEPILIINTLLYFITFIIITRKEKKYSLNSLIFLLYSIFSIFSILVYSNKEYYMWGLYVRNPMTISPLIFVFICLMIYFQAIKNFNTNQIKKITPLNTNAENCIFYGNILLLVFLIICFKSAAFTTTDYLEGYEREVNEIQTGFGQLAIYALTINAGVTPLQIIFPFYLLSKQRKKDYIKALIFIIIYFITNYILAMAMASRGLLFFTLINSVFMFFPFRKIISPAIKKMMLIICSYFLVIFISISILISIDRFGDDYIFRIGSYFGEPFLNLPLIFWNPPYFFDGKLILASFTSAPTPHSNLPTFLFTTMAGRLYLDFGIVGTVVFLIIYASIFKRIIGKSSEVITLEKLLIYCFFYTSIIYGIFNFKVLGWSGYTILAICYIYIKKNKINQT